MVKKINIEISEAAAKIVNDMLLYYVKPQLEKAEEMDEFKDNTPYKKAIDEFVDALKNGKNDKKLYYKVLEVRWYGQMFHSSFKTEYYATFETMEKAQQYIAENDGVWKSHLNKDGTKTISVEIETYETTCKSIDEAEDSGYNNYLQTDTYWIVGRE